MFLQGMMRNTDLAIAKKKKIIRNNGYSTEIQTGRNQSLKVSGNNFRKVAEHH